VQSKIVFSALYGVSSSSALQRLTQGNSWVPRMGTSGLSQSPLIVRIAATYEPAGRGGLCADDAVSVGRDPNAFNSPADVELADAGGGSR
jgi:hypothetical protein